MAERSERFAPEDAWREYAACASMDPAVFFPMTPMDRAAAVEACESCPVIRDCARYALDNPPLAGVWAGVSFQHDGKSKRRQRTRLRALLELPEPPPTRQYATVCGVCAVEFWSESHQARYCGDECREVGRLRAARESHLRRKENVS